MSKCELFLFGPLQALSLYRTILRLHRRLPLSMRFIGDQYVRQEFRNHRNIKDSQLLSRFFQEWQRYANEMSSRSSPSSSTHDPCSLPLGRTLSEKEWHDLSDEQVGQLHELFQEAKKKPFKS